jgi:hypothetical protein
MCLGDGSIGTTKLRGETYYRQAYYTSSKRLADDVQEIVLKIGKNCTIHPRDREALYDKKKNKTYKRKKQYDITVLNSKTVNGFQSKTHKFQNVWYKGFVYCIQIENKTMVTRRNGQTLITGRSERPTTVIRLQEASMNRQDLSIKLAEFTTLQNIAMRIVLLTRKYMKQADYEAIIGEKDAGFYRLTEEHLRRFFYIKPVGSSVTHVKEIRQSQMQFMLDTLMKIPPELAMQSIEPFTVNWYEAVRSSLEAADIKNIDRILLSMKRPPPEPVTFPMEQINELANIGYGGM